MERNTHQKRAVLAALKQLQGQHPAADDVVAHTRAMIPEISRATVYRIMNQLTEQGGLQRIPLSTSADRFDIRTEKHFHMRCLTCGAVVDVDFVLPDIETLHHHFPQEADYLITGYDLLFTGYCGSCNQPPQQSRT